MTFSCDLHRKELTLHPPTSKNRMGLYRPHRVCLYINSSGIVV